MAQLAGSADGHKTVAMLEEAVGRVANITATLAIDVDILEISEFGTRLALRPYRHTDQYWQVYFDTDMTIADTLGAAGDRLCGLMPT